LSKWSERIINNKEYQKKWEEKNKEYRREYKKQYYIENRERILQHQKKYRIEYPEVKKEYYQKNRDKISERYKGYYQENKDKISKHRRNYHQENLEKHSKQTKKWRKENPEYQKNRRINNPEKMKEIDKRHYNKRKRDLGFKPLNKYFEGSEAHHINKIDIIYIPKEIHRNISHCLENNKNMEEINKFAMNFKI